MRRLRKTGNLLLWPKVNPRAPGKTRTLCSQNSSLPSAQSKSTCSLGFEKGKEEEGVEEEERIPAKSHTSLPTGKTSPWTHLLMLIEHQLSARQMMNSE